MTEAHSTSAVPQPSKAQGAGQQSPASLFSLRAMALPVLPEDEVDLTPYLQEGAESSLLLCGLLTIGQTEYALFILFPTEESTSAGPKAKILDGWKMMTSVPSNISQRYVTIDGHRSPICCPEYADMNQRGLLVVGSNRKVRIGLQRIITNHYSFRDRVTPFPNAAAAETPSLDACKSFPDRVAYLSHLLRGDIPTEPQLLAPVELPQPLPGHAPAEWTLMALQRHYEQGLDLLDQLRQGATQSAHISQDQLEELIFPLAQMINQQQRLLQEYSTSRHST